MWVSENSRNFAPSTKKQTVLVLRLAQVCAEALPAPLRSSSHPFCSTVAANAVADGQNSRGGFIPRRCARACRFHGGELWIRIEATLEWTCSTPLPTNGRLLEELLKGLLKKPTAAPTSPGKTIADVRSARGKRLGSDAKQRRR